MKILITEKELLEIYARIPSLKCKPGCSACCGPVLVGKAELFRIKRWLKARGLHIMPLKKDLTCGYLQNGRCMIYNVRPLICRLFGVVDNKTIACRFVSLPKVHLLDEEATKMMVEVFKK